MTDEEAPPQQQAAQRRAVEGPSGSPQALTLEVDTDYYEALDGRDFDWQAAIREKTGTRVHWADSVVSPKQRRSSEPFASTESWQDENVADEELEEYSSWQISLGIANERAALTAAVSLATPPERRRRQSPPPPPPPPPQLQPQPTAPRRAAASPACACVAGLLRRPSAHLCQRSPQLTHRRSLSLIRRASRPSTSSLRGSSA